MKNIILALIVVITPACGGTSPMQPMLDGGMDSMTDSSTDGSVDGNQDAGQDSGPVVDYATCLDTDTDTGTFTYTVTTITGNGQGRDINHVNPVIQPACELEGADGRDNSWARLVMNAQMSYPVTEGDSHYFPFDLDQLMQDSLTAGGSQVGTKTVITVTISNVSTSRNDDCLHISLDVSGGNGPALQTESVGRMVDGHVESMIAWTYAGTDVVRSVFPIGFTNSVAWNTDHSEICTNDAPCGQSVLVVSLHELQMDFTVSQDKSDIVDGQITGFVVSNDPSNGDLTDDFMNFIVGLNAVNDNLNSKRAGFSAIRYSGDLMWNGTSITEGSCFFGGLNPETNGSAISVAWAISSL